ncbi:MAG: glycerol-3-phosphate dehydrogenase/oxidase [Chlorobi bacterium]|nr:glycerol-3-phosphate dehydrogenase/oxidase [Chlorobiota bacterium]
MINQTPFSSLLRSDIVQNIKTAEHDILIIGGGITGTGIALDAASRGLKVALIEQNDFAEGTSSRSTKLVHGGLRYLKQFDVALVHEVGHERENLHNNAAHLVIPEKMFLPIIKNGSLGKFSTRIGLTVYDFLAGVKKEERNIILSRKEALKREPLLNKELIVGGALYYEYKTSDSRLTIETAKKATQYGAHLINYVKATGFKYTNNKISGIVAKDMTTGAELEITAKYIVNAAGPWVDEIRKEDHSLKGKKLHLTKGVHLVVSKNKFPVQHANYFDVPDGRMIFVIPRNKKVYIGTTDTDYYREIAKPRVTRNDAAYLLKAVNRIFPAAKLTENDIEAAWAGLRPLIHKEGKSPSELSRKDEIFISNSGLISIAGGKLTGYRIMAKKIVNIVLKNLHKHHNYEYKKSVTKTIKLSGGEFPFKANIRQLNEYLYNKYDEAKQTGIQIEDFKTLFYRYGTNISIITEKVFELIKTGNKRESAWMKAEVWYAVNHEMAQSLEDFLIRRTELLYFDVDYCKEKMELFCNIFTGFLNWDEKKKVKELEQMKTNFNFIV